MSASNQIALCKDCPPEGSETLRCFDCPRRVSVASQPDRPDEDGPSQEAVDWNNRHLAEEEEMEREFVPPISNGAEDDVRAQYRRAVDDANRMNDKGEIPSSPQPAPDAMRTSPIGQADVEALRHLADSMGFGRTHDMLRRIIAATPYLSAPVPSPDGAGNCVSCNKPWIDDCWGGSLPDLSRCPNLPQSGAVAAELAAHYHHPSTTHMGDCSICGNVSDHPLHIGSASPAAPPVRGDREQIARTIDPTAFTIDEFGNFYPESQARRGSARARAGNILSLPSAPISDERALDLAELIHAHKLIVEDAACEIMQYATDVAVQLERDGYFAKPAPVSGRDAVIEEHHKLDNDRQVFFYEQDFYVLSNFSAFAMQWAGLRFDTSEAVYHWEKFNVVGSHEVQQAILAAPSAHEAFKIAERNKTLRRPDWDEVKVMIMRDILFAKAEQHEYVRRKLLATGDRELIEDSWRDAFWGWGPNRDGENNLGHLWVEVRTELRALSNHKESET